VSHPETTKYSKLKLGMQMQFGTSMMLRYVASEKVDGK